MWESGGVWSPLVRRRRPVPSRKEVVLGECMRPPGSFRGIGAAVVVGIQNDDDELTDRTTVSQTITVARNTVEGSSSGVSLQCMTSSAVLCALFRRP